MKRTLLAFSATIAALILFGLPTYLVSIDDVLKSPNTARVLLMFLAGASYIGIWVYANEMALVATLHLYGLRLPRILPIWNKNTTVARRQSKRTTLVTATIAYLTTIYGFALLFRFIQLCDTDAFAEKITNMVTATYFSIVTIATVGYGDITPKTITSRIVVSIEILLGVAYSVFFLSIIAAFIRERTQDEIAAARQERVQDRSHS